MHILKKEKIKPPYKEERSKEWEHDPKREPKYPREENGYGYENSDSNSDGAHNRADDARENVSG